jgi:hypothetical protein
MPLDQYHLLNGRLARTSRGVVLFTGEGYWFLLMSGRQRRWAEENELRHVTVDGRRIGFNVLSVRTIERTLPQYQTIIDDETGQVTVRARLEDIDAR